MQLAVLKDRIDGGLTEIARLHLSTLIAVREAEREKLVKALRAALRAIGEEVAASAGDEHPVIRAHQAVMEKGSALLRELGEE